MARTSRREERPLDSSVPLPSGELSPRPAPSRGLLLVVSPEASLAAEFRELASKLDLHVEPVMDFGLAAARLVDRDVEAVLLDLRNPAWHADSQQFLRNLATSETDAPILLPILGATESYPISIAGLLDVVADAAVTYPIDLRRIAEWIQAGTMIPRSEGARAFPRNTALDARVLRGQTIHFETRVKDLFQVLEELELAAAHDVTVLVVGETGSGKTTLAQLVHELSPRAGEKFMHLACGALPPSLIESELFGHAKGAFTGADRNKVGKFEAAGKGTLLLDEIDSLTLDQQAKLLRVIETGEFEPVGSNETRRLGARLIVASNVCLETLVANHRFRMDLYYRLNVLKFQLPPLRERPEDVVALALDFIGEVCRRCGVAIEGIHPDFLRAVKGYHWPGNIRELKNCMERAVILSRGAHLTTASLPPAVTQSVPKVELPGARNVSLSGEPTSLNHKVATSEQMIITEALKRHRNKRAPVARELGISRVTLYNKMRKYGLL
ncbi:MAG: sigma-54 dependent transcriptional regulator [Planctomycetota bacterium]